MKKIAILLLLLLFPLLSSAAPEFEEDLHYSSVIPAQPGGEGGRIQVLEFFWYGCGHCYRFEPYLEGWLENKPADVDFVKVPGLFRRPPQEIRPDMSELEKLRPSMLLHAETYYALELMGAGPEIHHKIFDAMHNQGHRLEVPEEMDAFLAGQGVDLKAYHNAMNSFAVNTQIKRALSLAKRYDLRAVPSLGVDGKYMTGEVPVPELTQLLDYLIDRVRQEKSAAASK